VTIKFSEIFRNFCVVVCFELVLGPRTLFFRVMRHSNIGFFKKKIGCRGSCVVGGGCGWRVKQNFRNERDFFMKIYFLKKICFLKRYSNSDFTIVFYAQKYIIPPFFVNFTHFLAEVEGNFSQKVTWSSSFLSLFHG
jgi:hypothetical protein